MLKRRSFFVVFLILVLVVGPALSDEAATQNWVKSWVPGWAENKGSSYFIPVNKESNFFPQRRGEVLSSGTAHQMRDLLYRHKADSLFVPDYSMVKEGYELRTQGQTAFEGINEVLEKVDGNNGTDGSAVQLQTTSKNAYGAINELNGKIGGLQEQIELKVSLSDLDQAVADAVEEQMASDVNTVYDSATQTRKYISIVDHFDEEEFLNN